MTLRPLAASDVGAVAAACRDREIQRWLPLPSPYGEADARYFIEVFAPGAQADGSGIVFAIDVEDALVGCIGLKDTDWASATTEIGYWVAPAARGQGVATRATRRLAEWALREQHIERVELRVQPGNVASVVVARRAGFAAEGVARSAGVHRDHRIDLEIFSLVTADLR